MAAWLLLLPPKAAAECMRSTTCFDESDLYSLAAEQKRNESDLYNAAADQSAFRGDSAAADLYRKAAWQKAVVASLYSEATQNLLDRGLLLQAAEGPVATPSGTPRAFVSCS